jgi:hypothetical protein
MPKITEKEKKPGRDTERRSITAKTTEKSKLPIASYQWWQAETDDELCHQLISTANYLQRTQQYRIRGASIFSRIYSGKGLMNYALNSKALDTSNQLPVRRPTMNVSQSCVDTLVSRLTQSRPRPVFLTENGSYKERNLAKSLNQFGAGELYRAKAYDLGEMALRDACVFGDGFIKVYENSKRVALERTLSTELFADKDDSWYGSPRQLVQFKLSDRNVIAGAFPDAKLKIKKATKAYVDGSGESSETVSDQIILIEGWRLPSFEGATDGRHAIVCSDGKIVDEPWKKQNFPFVKIPYNPHAVGWFSQGLVEMLMGTQLGIDTILRTISEAMNLVGVPRVFIDELSKVLETSLNNNVGTIVKYRGTKPSYEVAPCMPVECYEHLQRLIGYAYQISGISQLAAASQKPAGLNSGAAIRSFDDLQSDRFASLAKRYDNLYVDLTYQIIDVAKDIAERDGSYSTVYPNKDGTREVDLPKAAILKDNYIIQCYDESSLPRDPAGRYARLSEMLASGEITLQEFRRLSGFPDLEQSDRLANALEERILKTLDDIVENGKKPVADVFMLDPSDLATTLAVNYINVYACAKLEESKMEMIRNFIVQIQTLKSQSVPPPVPPPMEGLTDNPNALPPPAPPPTPMSSVSAA